MYRSSSGSSNGISGSFPRPFSQSSSSSSMNRQNFVSLFFALIVLALLYRAIGFAWDSSSGPEGAKLVQPSSHHPQTVPSKAISYRLLSYPKSGRTWLRVLLAKVFVDNFQLNVKEEQLLDLEGLSEVDSRIPKISVAHRIKPFTSFAHWSFSESIFQTKNILLVRDPRDVVVSHYYEAAYRMLLDPVYNGTCIWRRPMKSEKIKPYTAKSDYKPFCDKTKSSSGASFAGCSCFPPDFTLSDFIREEVGGFESILRYNELFFENRNKMVNSLIIFYEDLQFSALETVKRIMNFVDKQEVSNSAITSGINYATFSNMRKKEEQGNFGQKLSPTDKDNPATYKTREGAVGGFKKSCSESDISFMNNLMKNYRDKVAEPEYKDYLNKYIDK